MRYAIILAGGSGTRALALESRGLPKQLLPLAGAVAAATGLRPARRARASRDQRRVCAGESHRDVICRSLVYQTENTWVNPWARHL